MDNQISPLEKTDSGRMLKESNAEKEAHKEQDQNDVLRRHE